MRTTRWAMIAIALAFTLFAIAWPGLQVWPLVLSGALVGFAVFGLLGEEEWATVRSASARRSGRSPVSAFSETRGIEDSNTGDSPVLARPVAP